MRREPLSNREILTIVENLYDLILGVEQVKRDQPLPEEEQERHDEWFVLLVIAIALTHVLIRKNDYDELMDNVWHELRVLVPLDTRFVVSQFYCSRLIRRSATRILSFLFLVRAKEKRFCLVSLGTSARRGC